MTRKPAELKDEEIKAAVQDGLSKAVASMYTITPELIDAYERRAIATAATRKALEHATKLNGNRATLMTTEEHAADEWGRGYDRGWNACLEAIRKEIPDA